VVNLRPLTIELRRSSALAAAGLFTALTLSFLLLQSGPWSHGSGAWDLQWNGLATWQRNMLAYGWPLVLGGGTLLGLRDSRSKVSELLGSAPRPAISRAVPQTAALVLAMVAAYVVVFVIGAVQVIGNGGVFTFSWLPTFLVGLLAMVGSALLGLGLGRLVPSVLMPPAVAVVGLVLGAVFMFATDTAVGGTPILPNRVALLGPVIEGTRNAFGSVAGWVDLGQVAWFVGLTVTGFLLVASKNTRTRLLAVLPVLVGAAIAVPMFPAVATQNFVLEPTAVALVCDDHGPRVCVTKVHENMLGALVVPARTALAQLAKVPGGPTSVEELPSPQIFDGKAPVPPGVVPIDFDDYDLMRDGNVTTDPERLRLYVIAGAGTRACTESSYTNVREQAARTVAGAWAAGELKPLTPHAYEAEEIDPLAASAWRTLSALPAGVQRDRIVAMRAAAMSCSAELLSVLTGEPAR
jgi:hypothetical protein